MATKNNSPLQKGIIENDQYLLNRIYALQKRVDVLETPSDPLEVGHVTEVLGRLSINTVKEVGVDGGGLNVISTALAIPDNCQIIGVSITTDETIVTSAATNTWSADFITGDTTNIVTAESVVAVNTKNDVLFATNIITTAVTEIEFSAPGVETFTTGKWTVVVYYITLSSLDNT